MSPGPERTPELTPEQREQVRDLVAAAMKLPAPERSAYITEHSGGDEVVVREAFSLLEHLDEDDSFLEEAPNLPEATIERGGGDPSSGAAYESTEARGEGDANLPRAVRSIGRRIGNYKILKVLGEGGMGMVLLARQENPKRTVALKVIRPGLASTKLLARFEHEAHILGRLQHPGIAQIYEAGTAETQDGPQPYFVMEYVRGRTLMDHVRYHDLDLRARLALLAELCDAVQHAHQKGVIHRDLKPDNILVTDEGQPKVLDFGVARTMDSDLHVTTMQTNVGQLIGTLKYMSPEQAAGDPEALDTRSDVYALGVIGYVLLAGRDPYEMADRMIHEAVRIIQEEEPTHLSAINRVFRGDLETIIAKALEKTRQRRYQTAGELGTDIRRYLTDEPIIARPPTVTYQLTKFARKHRVLVGASGAVAVALVLGVIGTTMAMVSAQRERDRTEVARAEAVLARGQATRRYEEARDLARVFMGEFHDSVVELPGSLAARLSLVERAVVYVAGLEREAADDPTVLAEVAWGHRRLGQMMGGLRGPNLNRTDDALEHYRAAHTLYEQLAENHPDDIEYRRGVAWTHLDLGDIARRQRRTDEQRRHYEAALAAAETLREADREDRDAARLLGRACNKLGDLARLEDDDLDRAETLYNRMLETYRQLVALDPADDGLRRDLTVAYTRVGKVHELRDRHDEALATYELLREEREALLRRQPDSARRMRDVMIAVQLLGGVHSKLGQHAPSLERFTEALASAERLREADPSDERAREDVAIGRFYVGLALRKVGRGPDSRDQLTMTLAEYQALRRDFPDDPSYPEMIDRVRAALDKSA